MPLSLIGDVFKLKTIQNSRLDIGLRFGVLSQSRGIVSMKNCRPLLLYFIINNLFSAKRKVITKHVNSFSGDI